MHIYCHAHNAGDRSNITVNWGFLHAQNQGKLASVCLQRFSSIFESTLPRYFDQNTVKLLEIKIWARNNNASLKFSKT